MTESIWIISASSRLFKKKCIWFYFISSEEGDDGAIATGNLALP